MRPRAAGGSRGWLGDGKAPEASGSAPGSAERPLVPGDALGKEASLLPEDSPPRLHPCPPRLSFPSGTLPSLPSSGPGGSGGGPGPALEPPLSSLRPSPAPETLGVQLPQPRGRAARGGSSPPTPPHVGLVPPAPSLSPHGSSRGSAVAVGGLEVAWEPSLLSPPVFGGLFWDVLPVCRDSGSQPGMRDGLGSAWATCKHFFCIN